MKQAFKELKNFIKETDKILLGLCMLASAFGCISVMSATKWTVGNGGMFSRDCIVMIAAVCAGIFIALVISVIDYEFILKMTPLIGLVCIALMLLLFAIGVGPPERPDAKTWIDFGFVYFQPSEIVKVGFIITFGVHLERLKSNINHPFSILQLGIHALIPIGLVIKTGDMGSALVFMIIAIAMLFIAGLHWGYFLAGGLLIVAALPLAWMFLLDNIQKDRFLALAYPDLYPDIIYQQKRGLAALGGGGITGQGLFKGSLTQIPNAIPEAENDMIFTVIGEELGLIGCIIALLILTFIVLRVINTGRHDNVGNTKVMCYGVAAMIIGQVIINVGMCLMLLPVIGITLPFFSAGGSSNLCIYFSIGLILSFYRYNQQRDMIHVSQSNIYNPFSEI
jgi:rod shape determining protein RodA